MNGNTKLTAVMVRDEATLAQVVEWIGAHSKSGQLGCELQDWLVDGDLSDAPTLRALATEWDEYQAYQSYMAYKMRQLKRACHLFRS